MYNIKGLLKLYLVNKKWRKKNLHNETSMGLLFPMEFVEVGNATYGEINAKFYNYQNERLIIGNYVSIGSNVNFCMGGEHNTSRLFTYPCDVLVWKNDIPKTKGWIVVEDDVWIGFGSLILSGVTIGKGAVVAAGSVVTKDVPPFAIVASNKLIRYRFPEKIRNLLMKLDYGKLSFQDITKLQDVLSVDITENNMESVYYAVLQMIQKENE